MEKSHLDWMGIKIKPMELKDLMKEERVKQQKASQWISVKDDLPEHLEKVLFYDSELYGILTGVLNKAGGLNTWHSLGKQIQDVTHWAPLPEPPKD